MRTETLSSPGLSMLLVIATLPHEHSLRSLRQLMDRNQSLVSNALYFLEKDGCIRQNAQTGGWHALPGDSLDRAVAHAEHYLTADVQCPPVARSLLLLRRKNMLQGCEGLLVDINGFMQSGASAAILTCLDILIAYLRDFSFRDYTNEDVRRYLMLLLEVQGISMHMAKRSQEALALLPLARQAAAWLGDRRMPLLVDLSEAEQRHLAYSHNTVQPYDLLNRTLEALRELGDHDIMTEIAPYLGTLHCMQANYVQTIKYMQMASHVSPLRTFDYFIHMAPRYIASSASSLCQFDMATGVLEAAFREARLKRHKLKEKWFQTHLADILLRMGRTDAAMEHLNAVFPCCDPESETKLWIWNVRSLAYFHYQQKNIRTSHRILYEGMRQSAQYELGRPYYGFTWLLDMLAAYEEEGLPPIPGYELEKELATALQSPNRHLKSGALRVRAQQQRRLGAEPDAVRALLQRSLELALDVSDPLEIARTRLALAHCLYQLGNLTEAEAMQDAARNTLAEHNQHDCPAPPPHKKLPDLYVPSATICIAKCTATLESLPEWTDFSEHLLEIMKRVCSALEIERAALFTLEERHLRPVSSRHITFTELESAGFTALHPWILQGIKMNSSAIQSDEEGARLCLPLTPTRHLPYVLYLECVYLPERITRQDASVFEHLRQCLNMELHTALNVQQRMRENQLAVEKKARIAAARLDYQSNLYYGASMTVLLQQAHQAATTDASVLIEGETGVGKEILARYLHIHSGRTGPFVPVHPASTPENLFESEFFGHEKGSFTGAQRQKIGLFEVADKGTLFIDELGEVPLPMQVKLLRVLQEKAFLRVGGIREMHSDFRIICATNRDCSRMVQEGSFREDLYYRLSVVPLRLPALRERPDDILPLALSFLEHYSRRYQRTLPSPVLSLNEQRKLQSYPWPGNIRELKSVIERTIILYTSGPLHFFLEKERMAPVPAVPYSARQEDTLCADIPQLEELQKRYIKRVLAITRGKIGGEGGAAHILGVTRSTLYAKIRKYKLDAASLLYGPENPE